MSTIDTDILIVGYGPVGQTMAALLARRGHRVEVYERFADLYDLPRAVYFDDEIMQVWQALGIADELRPAAGQHVRVVRRGRRADPPDGAPGHRPVRLGAGVHVLPADPRAGA